jgi:hypothetical protein
MINLPASSHPRLAGRGIPRICWRAAGLVVAALAFLAGAPAALAVPLPPTDGGGPAVTPPPPPSITAAAHLPLSAVAAIVAATVVLSVATTLLTLSLERRRQARRTPTAAAESPIPRIVDNSACRIGFSRAAISFGIRPAPIAQFGIVEYEGFSPISADAGRRTDHPHLRHVRTPVQSEWRPKTMQKGDRRGRI